MNRQEEVRPDVWPVTAYYFYAEEALCSFCQRVCAPTEWLLKLCNITHPNPLNGDVSVSLCNLCEAKVLLTSLQQLDVNKGAAIFGYEGEAGVTDAIMLEVEEEEAQKECD